MLRANLVIVIVVMEVTKEVKEVMVEDNSRVVIMVEGTVMVVETVVDTEVEVEVEIMAVVMVMKIIQNGWKSLVNLVLISQSTIQFQRLDSIVKIKNFLVIMLIKELNVKYKKLLKLKKLF